MKIHSRREEDGISGNFYLFKNNIDKTIIDKPNINLAE